LHGLALMVQVFWSKLGFKLWTWLAWLITFNFVNITWVFFRAKEWGDAVKVLEGMFIFSEITTNFIQYKEQIIYLSIALFIVIFCKSTIYYSSKIKSNVAFVFIISLLFTFSIQFINDTNAFVYFDF